MIVGCSEYIFLDRQRHRAQDSFRKIGAGGDQVDKHHPRGQSYYGRKYYFFMTVPYIPKVLFSNGNCPPLLSPFPPTNSNKMAWFTAVALSQH